MTNIPTRDGGNIIPFPTRRRDAARTAAVAASDTARAPAERVETTGWYHAEAVAEAAKVRPFLR